MKNMSRSSIENHTMIYCRQKNLSYTSISRILVYQNGMKFFISLFFSVFLFQRFCTASVFTALILLLFLLLFFSYTYIYVFFITHKIR
jgi:hypothetical protein